MTAEGKILSGRNYRYFEVYVSLAIIYWAITIILEKILKLIEKKISVPDQVEQLNAAEAEALRTKGRAKVVLESSGKSKEVGGVIKWQKSRSLS